MRPSARLMLIAAMALVAGAAGATTIAPPASLDDLAVMSDSVVLARAVESYGIQGTMFPRTVTVFRLVDAVGGARPGTYFDVAEPGGAYGGKGFAVSGVTSYHPGNTYLLFLAARPDGRWASRMLAYGTFVEDGRGRLVPVPEARDIGLVCAEGVRRIAPYPEQALLAHLRGVVGDGPAAPMPEPLPGSTASGPSPSACRQITYSDGFPVRWFGFETTTVAQVWATTPGQTGLADGGTGAVSGAASAWSGYPNAAMNLQYQGTRAANVNCSSGASSANNVVFNDPCNEIPDMVGCSGTLAFGGTWFSLSTQPYDGTQWHVASAPFVVVNNGAECMGATQFAEMMTHELGHSLGFGHHTDPDATMYYMCCHGARGAALGATDGQCASWQYHTFLDVPYDHWAWPFIEGIQNASITAGCGSGNYCPDTNVTRAQMAAFLLASKEGSGYSPPSCTTPPFLDVPCSNMFSAWIGELAARGITAGCGGGNYCPGDPTNREQMAVFLLATLEGSSYSPPPCTSPTFADVPCSSPYAAWIEELVSRGITAGCGGGNYCPGNPVTRAEMAVFLSATFSIPHP